MSRNVMSDLVNEATGRAGSYGGGAVCETPIGEIRLSISPANCLNSGRNKQWRKVWYLDGKRISAANLEALLAP